MHIERTFVAGRQPLNEVHTAAPASIAQSKFLHTFGSPAAAAVRGSACESGLTAIQIHGEGVLSHRKSFPDACIPSHPKHTDAKHVGVPHAAYGACQVRFFSNDLTINYRASKTRSTYIDKASGPEVINSMPFLSENPQIRSAS